MASTSVVLFPSNYLATGAAALLYTSPANGKGTYLDVATALNDSAGAQTITLHITPGVAAAANQHVKAKSIAIGATDLLPEMRGKFIAPGASVWGFASASPGVTLYMSGRELT